MARDVRKLREEANEATASGKYKRALTSYLELERLEPNDAQWSKRVAETYRRLGKDRDAIDAFARAVERYAQGGFLVQAIAVCKLILQIDPKNDDALRRLGSINEQIGAGPSRAVVLAQANPELESSAAVQHLKTQGTGAYGSIPPRRNKVSSAPPTSVPRTVTPQQLRARPHTPSDPPIAMARTKSKPITLPPGRAIDAVSLAEQVETSFEREEKSGVFVIPLDDQPIPVEDAAIEDDDDGVLPLEVEAPDEPIAPIEVEEQTELELNDLEEIPLPEPRMLGAAAAEALAATPLFAGLPHEALESLVAKLGLVQLSPDEILFHEGDPGDALYVIVEGELSVQAEGPPRVEMARLGAGSFIGEVALMTDQPRSATVIARTDTELLRIDRPTLAHVLATHGEVLAAVLRFVRDRLVDRWTRTSPLFRPFGDEERAQLASRFKFLEVQSGATLLAQNTRPDGLYIVLAGQFLVRRGGQDVARLGPGEMIGESALLSGALFKSDVVARGKSLALCLPAADFRELIMTHPHVLEVIGEQAEQSRKLQIL